MSASECDLGNDVSGDMETTSDHSPRYLMSMLMLTRQLTVLYCTVLYCTVLYCVSPDVHVNVDQTAEVVLLLLLGHGLLDPQPPVVHLQR